MTDEEIALDALGLTAPAAPTGPAGASDEDIARESLGLTTGIRPGYESTYGHAGPARGFRDPNEGETFGRVAAMAGPTALGLLTGGTSILGGAAVGGALGLATDWAQRRAGVNAPEADASHAAEYGAYGAIPGVLTSALTRHPVVGLTKNLLQYGIGGGVLSGAVKAGTDWLRGEEFDPWGTAQTAGFGAFFSSPQGVNANRVGRELAAAQAARAASASKLGEEILASKTASMSEPSPLQIEYTPPAPTEFRPTVDLAEGIQMDYPKPDESITLQRSPQGGYFWDDYRAQRAGKGYSVVRRSDESPVGEFAHLRSHPSGRSVEDFLRQTQRDKTLPIVAEIPESTNLTPPGIKRQDVQTANPWPNKSREELQTFADNTRQPPKTDSEPPRQPPKTGMGPGGQTSMSDILDPYRHSKGAAVGSTPSSPSSGGPSSPPPAGVTPAAASAYKAQGKLTNPDGSPVYYIDDSPVHPLREREGMFESFDKKIGYGFTRTFGGLARNPQAMARFGEKGLITELMNRSRDVFRNEARFSTRVKALLTKLNPDDRALVTASIYDDAKGSAVREMIKNGQMTDPDTASVFAAIQDEIEDLKSLDGFTPSTQNSLLPAPHRFDDPRRLVSMKPDAQTGASRRMNELEIGIPSPAWKQRLPKALQWLPEAPRTRQLLQTYRGDSPISTDLEGILETQGRRLAEETATGAHFGFENRRVNKPGTDIPLYDEHPTMPSVLADEAERIHQRAVLEGHKGEAVETMFRGTVNHLLDRREAGKKYQELLRVGQGLMSDVALGLSGFSNYGQRKMSHIFLGEDFSRIGQMEYDANEVIPHIGKTPREIIEGSGALTTGMTREFLNSGAGQETMGFKVLEWVENERLRSRDSWASVIAAQELSKKMSNSIDFLNSSEASWQAKLLGWDPSELASRRGVLSENDMAKTHANFVGNTQYFNAPGEVSPGTQNMFARAAGMQWMTYGLRQPTTWDTNIKNLLTSGDKALQRLGATYAGRAAMYQPSASMEAALIRSLVSGKFARHTNLIGPESDEDRVGPVEMGMDLVKNAAEGTFGVAATPMSMGIEAFRGAMNAPEDSTLMGRGWEGVKAGLSEGKSSLLSNPWGPVTSTVAEASYDHPMEAAVRGAALAAPGMSMATPLLAEGARKMRLAWSQP